MTDLRITACVIGVAGFLTLPAAIRANTYQLRRDNVIPVVFEDRLTLTRNRPGDVFTVRVGDSGELPIGTELRGRIDRVHPPRGTHPASMDLRFTEILLPDHSRVPLDASPIALDDRYVTHFADGRIVAKQDLRKQQGEIFGGAIAGYVVGSLFHRRFTGTVIGTMLGVSAADAQRAKDNNLIASPGDKVGALINRDVVIDYAVPPQRFDINRRLDQRMADPVRGSYRRIIEHNTTNELRLSYSGQEISFPAHMQPFRLGSTVMVALAPCVDKFNFRMERGPERAITVEGRGKSLHLSLNSKGARLDDRRFDLPRTVLEINGSVYVPLDALVMLVDADILVNGKKYDGG